MRPLLYLENPFYYLRKICTGTQAINSIGGKGNYTTTPENSDTLVDLYLNIPESLVQNILKAGEWQQLSNWFLM